MVLPIDSLYEMSFHLIYLLKIQPSEINNLSVPESRSYIKYYEDLKRREREAYEEYKASRSSDNNSGLRRHSRRR